jgi:maltose/moltooligosaccharide transporter
MSETTAQKIKINWKYTIIFGMWFAAWFVIWGTYNSYVPVILQSGNPAFNVLGASKAVGFGLGAFVTGLIMSLDNLSIVLLQPIFGNWSDRVKSRKRLVIIGGLLAALCYLVLPFGFLGIPPEKSGNLSALIPFFAITIIAATSMVFSWSIALPAENGLKFVMIPSAMRTRVWSIIAFFGGIAFVFTFMTSNMLYTIHPGLPFWVGGGFLLLVVILYALFIKEPAYVAPEKSESDEPRGLASLFSGLKQFSKEDLRALLTVSFIKFLTIFGVAAIETFGVSYIINELGVPENKAAMNVAIYFVGYLIAAIPAGYLSNRFGRKTMLRIALILFIIMAVLQFTINSMSTLLVVLVLLGVANSITDVMCLPMATEMVPSKKVMGVTIGTMTAITTLASVISVPFWGAMIQSLGNDFRVIFIAVIVGPFLAFLLTFRLKGRTGEAKPITEEETKW